MHGHLIADRKELTEKERDEERSAAETACARLDELMRRKREKDYSSESFVTSLELVKLNPELGLAWNFRREAILASDESARLVQEELKLLNSVMMDRQMTKSYCLWTHRRWLLRLIENKDTLNQTLQDEKILVEKLLHVDGRNFHAWSYRQWLRMHFASLEWEDLQFSLHLIEADFSNYSAWFLRRSCWKEIELVKDAELELIWNALFTEPNDQSCWQYHDWLVEKFPELKLKDEEYMRELEAVVEEKDSKYVLLHKLNKTNADEKVLLVEKLVYIDPNRKQFYLDLIES